jgi:hypothetical protein
MIDILATSNTHPLHHDTHQALNFTVGRFGLPSPLRN